MDPEDYAPQRPLSIAVPKAASIHGPCCPRKPNLREILANTSEAPWTLAAFMAYLSSNHCLETLEFTMDAGRYRKHYAKMMAKAGTNGLPPTKERDFVQQLWERLVEAYIQPSGTREVNIPSNVRDPILNMRPDRLPPPPEALDPAVEKVYELMEESVLVPFLNSVYPQSSSPMMASQPRNRSDESIPGSKTRQEVRSSQERLNRHARNLPTPQPSSSRSSNSPSTAKAKPNRSTYTTSNPARTSAGNLVATTSGSDVNVSGTGSGAGMTDDSASTDSPANESPTTPPTTPPLSEMFLKRDSGMWKRLGRLSGVKDKKKPEGSRREGQ